MPILEVRNLKKSFGNTQVLKGIDFTLAQGEVMAIIGSSGSGKTTLLRCLNFLETADAGTIAVNGETLFDSEEKKSVSDDALGEKRLHFGLVFQSFNLFPQYTVLRNISLAQELLAAKEKGFRAGKKEILSAIDQNSRDLLKRVGLTEKANAYPCELSGGQQQRVAIARALALKPEILCFDEPTSALDPELTGEVLKVIRGLKSSDSTMIVVTHEIEFARNVADKVIFMGDGVILEEGTPQEVLDNPQNPRTQAFLSKLLK